jgi:hypothetical protein
MLEDLANSRYLITAYASASDSWENFRQTGQQASLYEVAAILCGAWTTLDEDFEFMGELSDLTADRMAPDLLSALHGKVVPGDDPTRDTLLGELAAYSDTDKLLARELVVLVQAGMTPVHAVRLVGDLQDLLAPRIEPLSDTQVRALQRNVPRLARELCSAEQTLKVFDYDLASEASKGRAPHPGWVRNLRTVGKGLSATAGAASAAGNVVAAVASAGVASGLAWASVVAGVGAMSTAIASVIEWRTPGSFAFQVDDVPEPPPVRPRRRRPSP